MDFTIRNKPGKDTPFRGEYIILDGRIVGDVWFSSKQKKWYWSIHEVSVTENIKLDRYSSFTDGLFANTKTDAIVEIQTMIAKKLYA